MINKYNETQWALWMIDNGFRSNRKMYELNILAKFLYANGVENNELKNTLMNFCDRHMSSVNEVRTKELINEIVKNVHKLRLIDIPEIEIYRHEIQELKSNELLNYEEEKLLFVLLCMYKLNIKAHNNKFNNEKWTKIAALSKIKNKNNIYKYMKSLNDMGYIRICHNGAIEFMYENKFLKENPVIKFTVSDYDNLGDIYLKVTSGKYKKCKDCGRLIDVRVGRTNLCKECSNLHQVLKKKKYYQNTKFKIST